MLGPAAPSPREVWARWLRKGIRAAATCAARTSRPTTGAASLKNVPHLRTRYVPKYISWRMPHRASSAIMNAAVRCTTAPRYGHVDPGHV
jgi:hypothetical protein